MRTKQKATRHRVISRHVDRLGTKISELQALDQRYFWVRLAVLIAGALGLFLAYQTGQSRMLLATILVFLVIFSLVVYLNRRVRHTILRFQLSSAYFKNQLARMDLDWENIPDLVDIIVDESHPFANDLDIPGEESIHRLINTALSRGGGDRLLSWLLEVQPELEDVIERQAAVKEICVLSGFRSRLVLSSSLATAGGDEAWDGEQLLRWLNKYAESRSLKPLLILLSVLAAANLLLFVLFLMDLLPAVWFITLAVYAAVYLLAYRNMDEVFSQAHHLSTTLEKFRAVLVYLEGYAFKPDSHLTRLCKQFQEADRRPSGYLRRISAIASAASISANPVLWLLVNVVVPWDVFFSYQLQRYKIKMQHVLPKWLDAWYELEAINSLANFAYLNPDYSFPMVLNHKNGRCFDAKGIGHPLIQDEERICNDFALNELGDMVIITGSNMSGKSTFLRTIGINLSLAYAGAPVNAESLDTRLFRLFSVIQVVDSLADGISYFYAEVRRLKALVDALEQDNDLPLFFLIDEIFRGTNNRERQIGSRAYVKMLVGGNGTGLISTHDLELVSISEQVPNVSNFHFEEQVADGRMLFDYCLRKGPSKTTNALQIMRMEGLLVEGESADEEPGLKERENGLFQSDEGSCAEF
jgi:ABC-type multidrug transport system fused ATPase/permease subunit